MEPNSNNIFNDIKPLTKYTSDDPLKKETEVASNTAGTLEPYKLRMSDPLLELSQTKSSYKGIWFFAILALLILGGVLSFYFSKAFITITPKSVNLPVDKVVFLTKANTELPFETVEITKDVEVALGQSQKTELLEKAKGEIVISNSFSSAPQKLVKNTRFQNESGLIFRIDKEIVVPGYKLVDAKVIPGEITVFVTADVVGEEYNLKKETILTIPGFKGSSQYDKIFAKIKSDFSGGANGTYYKSTASRDEIEKGLKEKTDSFVHSEINQKIPQEYVAFDDLYTTTFNIPDSLLLKEEKASLVVPVSVEYIIFKKTDLENYFKKIFEVNNEENIFVNPKTLSAKIVSTDEDASSQYPVSFSGFIKKEATIPVSQILLAVKGKTKAEFLSTIEGFSTTIEKAELTIKPFWVFKIPKDDNKIKIKENK